MIPLFKMSPLAVSDNSLGPPRRTRANVDLRMKESRRAGEYLVGTRLGELSTIAVDLDFSYAKPVADSDLVTGTATLTKRSGEVIERDLVCARYLKLK